jgi:hypothetical protein
MALKSAIDSEGRIRNMIAGGHMDEATAELRELEDKYPTQVEEADVGYFSGESEEEAEEVYEEEQAAPQESYPSYAMGISM